MRIITTILVLLVAGLHIGFGVLEMVLWTEPTGREIFGTSEAFANESATLAMNQGLYNLFLAAGLLWGLVRSKGEFVIFFLLCVIFAGVFGALTVKPSIFYIQAVPAILALGTWVVARKS